MVPLKAMAIILMHGVIMTFSCITNYIIDGMNTKHPSVVMDGRQYSAHAAMLICLCSLL
jgi:hypothetical protein